MVFDPISLATGAALLSAGWLAARVRRSRPAIAGPTPTCSCGHPLAVHDREANECLREVERPHYWKTGERQGFEYVRCPCRRYDGPEPITDLWLPPLAIPEKED